MVMCRGESAARVSQFISKDVETSEGHSAVMLTDWRLRFNASGLKNVLSLLWKSFYWLTGRLFQDYKKIAVYSLAKMQYKQDHL